MESNPVWFIVSQKNQIGMASVVARNGRGFPDGTRIADDDEQAADALASGSFLYEVETVDKKAGIARVTISGDVVAGAPPMWFCWVDEPAASPAAATLVAYADDRQPAGTIVTNMQFASMMNIYDGQAGAIRWYHDGGRIHQIYVSPERRRENIGSMLIYTAAGFHQANGWPGHLHGDGRRTDLGERFAAGVRHPQRVAPLTEIMPGMD
jgi:ribosomal protein S18 acetylase RimI-like enzyme